MMKKSYKIIFLFLVMGILASCQNKDYRNYEYMPDMYEEVSYEANGSYDLFPNTMETMDPAPGSVKRGELPYEYEDSHDGYLAAKADLENPLPYTEDNYNDGKELYTLYCAICHGDSGNGEGNLPKREKILGIPSYDDQGRAITEGSIFHVMYYGLNNMGSYATQTTDHELWQIDMYVMSLKRELEGAPKRDFVEATITSEVHQAGQEPHRDDTAMLNADANKQTQE